MTREERIASQKAQLSGDQNAIKAAQAARTAAQTPSAAAADPTANKPSPQSVTGIPKTNNNNNISGSTPSSDPVQDIPTKTDAQRDAAIKARAAAYGNTTLAPDKVQNQGSWINSQQQPPTETDTTGTSTDVPAPSASTGTAGTSTPAATTEKTDEQKMTEATDKWTEGKNKIAADLIAQKESDLALINASAQKKQEELDRSLNVLNTLHEQNLQSINEATDASRAANEAALRKQEANTKLAQQQVDQKYLELKAAQNLENKRAEVKKETALGVLGGSFSTAGAAEIEETIMQGAQALNNLGLSNITADQKFNDDLNSFYDDYRTKNLEIQQYKTSKINESYANLQNSIASIQASKEMAEEEKTQAILAAGKYYNSQVTAINGEIVHAQYDLSQNVMTRADYLKAQAEAAAKEQSDTANKERDDARAVLKDIITNYSGEALANMTDEQKKQLSEMELKAGYPQGFVSSGVESMKGSLNEAKINQMNISTEQKQQLIDLKAKLGTKVNVVTDENGQVSVVYSDPITKKTSVISAGDIGKPDSPWRAVKDESTGEWTMVNTQSGTAKGSAKPVSEGGKKGDVQDALETPNGSFGGQCGSFVNDYLSTRIMGDSEDSKTKNINSDTPEIGAVFVTKYKSNGHTGFVKDIGTIPSGQYKGQQGILAKDSNFVAKNTIGEHWIPLSQVIGYVKTSGAGETSSYKPRTIDWSNPLKAITDSLANLSDKEVSGLSRSQLIEQTITKSEEAKISVDKKVLNSMSDEDLRKLLKERMEAAAIVKQGNKATLATKESKTKARIPWTSTTK